MTNYVTVNGNTYNDGNVPPGNMGNDGHRTNLIPMFSDTIIEVDEKVEIATDAADVAVAAAASAVSGPGTSATSTTSLTIGSGSKALTIQTGKSIVVGMSMKIASTASPTNWMHGDVTAYDTGTGALTVNVTKTNGSGTLAAWTVSLSGPAGAEGGVTSVTNPTASVTLTSATIGLHKCAMTAIGQSITAPAANTLTVGGPRCVIDNSTGSYAVGFRDGTGALIMAVGAGGVGVAYLSDASGTAGVWSVEGTNLEPGLILADSTFSATYTGNTLVPFAALDDNKSIHFLRIASGFAAVAVDKTTGAWGTPVTVSATANAVPKAAWMVTATTAIVFYGETNNSLYGVVLTLSGATTLAVGTPSTQQTGTNCAIEDSLGAPKIVQLATTLYAVSWATGTGAGATPIVAFQISGGTAVNKGSEIDILTSNNVANSVQLWPLTATTVLAIYGEGAASPYALKAVVISVTNANPPVCTAGTKVALATATLLAGDFPVSACPFAIGTKYGVAFYDTANSRNSIACITVSGTTVSWSSADTSGLGGPLTTQLTFTAPSEQGGGRYAPRLARLTANTALLSVHSNDQSQSAQCIITESSGGVSPGTVRYNCISDATAATSAGYGRLQPVGATEFISIRQRTGSAAGGALVVVPTKISGTSLNPNGVMAPLPIVGSANELSCTRLSGGTYVLSNQNQNTSSGSGAVPVFSSNGDTIRYKGEIKVPGISANNTFAANAPRAVSASTVVVMGSNCAGNLSTSGTELLRSLLLEVVTQ